MSVYKRTIVSKDGKKSLYWYIEVGLPGGKKIKRSIGKVSEMTKAVAREVELDLKHKVKLGRWDMIRNIPTFNEFIADFISYVRDIKHNRAWRGTEDCVESFARFFGNKRLSEINSADIEDYKRIRTQEGRKPGTINKELAFVRHLFNYAKRCKRFYSDNPVSVCGLLSVNNQKTRVITPEEEALPLANAEEPLKSMIQIALLTGLRLNSIRTLKWSCVDLNTYTMTVEAIHSKNKRTQVLPISNALRKILLEAKFKCRNSEYVLPGAAVLPKSAISTHFDRLCKKLGIHGVRFHDLRHTAATRMIESGISIVAVSKILGHSDIKITMRYAHPDNSLREAVEILANFANSTTNSTTTENSRDANSLI
ncbi:MAG: tyrosine-type recombinase/integrase [Ignavibacteriales bacterium]